jgi:hypothetical protein
VNVSSWDQIITFGSLLFAVLNFYAFLGRHTPLALGLAIIFALIFLYRAFWPGRNKEK